MPHSYSHDLVLRKLSDTFPKAEEASQALAMLEGYGDESWHREKHRVQLAVLMQSGGNLERLRQLVELAKTDYRDALVGAEFAEQFRFSPNHKPEHEVEAARQRDRQKYESWLNSGGA